MTREEGFKETYNPCDECDYSYSKNNQEMGMCKICEFNKLLQEPERKRGRWIKLSDPDENDNIKCRCSECHAEDVHSKSAIVPFCWNCGADMRGEQE